MAPVEASPASTLHSSSIRPRFWTGVSPIAETQYTIDCSEYDLSDGVVIPDLLARAREIHERLAGVGVVLLRNTGLEGKLDAMGDWGREIMGDAMKYEGGANYRKGIIKNVYDTGAPKEAWLHYHHEMAYVNQSTKQLAFCCVNSVSNKKKGFTFLSDNVKVTEAILKTPFGQKLKEKGICYIRCLNDEAEMTKSLEEEGIYNTWQQSFGVQTQEKVEEIARSKGLEVEWGPGRYLRTKYYARGFEYCPQVDRNLLYSSIADNGNWFDTWPGVMELPDMVSFETATPAQRPLKITFGDDTCMTQEELQQFCDAYDEFGFPLEWQAGDIAVICNYRFAHGRPEYALDIGEERTLGVCLGPMFDRVGEMPDKW